MLCQAKPSSDPNAYTLMQTFTALAKFCTIFCYNINSLFIISPGTSWLLRESDYFWKWSPGACWLIGPRWFGGNKGGRDGRDWGSAVEGASLLLAQSCRLHSSQAPLDPCLAATPIISQSDRVTGAASLSPVLNHSISAAEGEGGGTRNLFVLQNPHLQLRATLKTAWAQLMAALFMQRNVRRKYCLCGLVANSAGGMRCESVCSHSPAVYEGHHHWMRTRYLLLDPNDNNRFVQEYAAWRTASGKLSVKELLK